MPTRPTYPRVCPECNKSYVNRKQFYRHKFACKGPVKCPTCQHPFHLLKSLQNHKCTSQLCKCPEPNCNFTAYHKKILINHVEEVHLSTMTCVNMVFDSYNTFEDWKDKESAKTFSYYIKGRGRVGNYQYFQCQFSRSSRFSRKIPNYNCLSRIYVKLGPKITVQYYPRHNHEMSLANLKYQPYSKSTVRFIKESLAAGLTPEQIRNQIISSYAGDSTRKEHFISVAYIYQMKYIMKRNGKLNESSELTNDASTIQMLNKEKVSKKQEYNIIEASEKQTMNLRQFCDIVEVHLNEISDIHKCSISEVSNKQLLNMSNVSEKQDIHDETNTAGLGVSEKCVIQGLDASYYSDIEELNLNLGSEIEVNMSEESAIEIDSSEESDIEVYNMSEESDIEGHNMSEATDTPEVSKTPEFNLTQESIIQINECNMDVSIEQQENKISNEEPKIEMQEIVVGPAIVDEYTEMDKKQKCIASKTTGKQNFDINELPKYNVNKTQNMNELSKIDKFDMNTMNRTEKCKENKITISQKHNLNEESASQERNTNENIKLSNHNAHEISRSQIHDGNKEYNKNKGTESDMLNTPKKVKLQNGLPKVVNLIGLGVEKNLNKLSNANCNEQQISSISKNIMSRVQMGNALKYKPHKPESIKIQKQDEMRDNLKLLVENLAEGIECIPLDMLKPVTRLVESALNLTFTRDEEDTDPQTTTQQNQLPTCSDKPEGIQINKYHITYIELKCLDNSVSDEEAKTLKVENPDYMRGWLYDSVIDGFMSLLVGWSEEFSYVDIELSRHLAKVNPSSPYNPFLLMNKKILLPFNPNNHWVLLFIDASIGEITILDPTSRHHQSSLVNSILKNCLPLIDESRLLSTWKEKTIPRYGKSGVLNSAVYICYYADQIINKRNINKLFKPNVYQQEIYNRLLSSAK